LLIFYKNKDIAMNDYASADTALTLGEALQRLRAATDNDITDRISPEISAAVEQHDAVHILFDLGTSIQDEIAVHVWMLFGTTAKISEMHRAVAEREHQHVLAGIGHLKLIGIWAASVPRLVSIIGKSRRMNKRLAVAELATLKQQSIGEIRREHGIVV
jgi:hypothetical protein